MNYKKFSLFSITGLFVLFIMVFATFMVPFKDLKAVAEENDKTFKGYSQNMSAEEIHSKLTRDWLANNINHPNDFGVRLYAQVILNTIVGNDYFIFE